jgi:hypothetical protein
VGANEKVEKRGPEKWNSSWKLVWLKEEGAHKSTKKRQIFFWMSENGHFLEPFFGI